jgi:hypothetical protein
MLMTVEVWLVPYTTGPRDGIVLLWVMSGFSEDVAAIAGQMRSHMRAAMIKH